MDTVKTNPIQNSKMINVQITSIVKELIHSHGKAIAAGAAVVSGVAFVSARYLSPISDVEETPKSKASVLSAEELCEPNANALQVECSDIIQDADQTNSSFDQVFADQRNAQGAGGIFEYQGKLYNTYLKEEWETLTEAEKNSYYDKVSGDINLDDVKIITTNMDGQSMTLTYNSENLMNLTVVDSDHDGIVDVAQVDINFDGVSDYEYEIEKQIVSPTDDNMATDENMVIDAGTTPSDAVNDDIVDIDDTDVTMINPNQNDMETDNVFDEQIGKYDLPGIIDDMDMSEFNH